MLQGPVKSDAQAQAAGRPIDNTATGTGWHEEHEVGVTFFHSHAIDHSAKPDAASSSSSPRRLPLLHQREKSYDANVEDIVVASTDGSPVTAVQHSSPLGQPCTGRNNAPGVPDRRKTLNSRENRKSLRGGGVGGRRLAPASPRFPVVTVTMADVEGKEQTFVDAKQEVVDSGEAEKSAEGQADSKGAEGSEYGKAADAPKVTDGAEEKEHSTIEPTSGKGVTLEDVPSLPPPQVTSPEGSESPAKHMQGLSGDFAVTYPAPPSTSDRIAALEQRHPGESRTHSLSPPPRPPAEGLARKMSSGFGGFLGRMGSIRKAARSPPARQGRFGAQRTDSVASTESAGGLAPISDAHETSGGKPTLQDQFRRLRSESELTSNGLSNESLNGDGMTRTQSDFGIEGDATHGLESPPPRPERAASTPNLLKSPPLNPSLPPGTASGLSAGPADEPRAINWSLWEQVVYGGPAAVRRTSGAELQSAIASGIPPAIRGVVWQVLAESKNEELESIYRTLKARGSEPEGQLQPRSLSRSESQNTLPNGTGSHADRGGSVSSSRSSTHSTHSTPATSALASPQLTGETTPNPLETHGALLAEKQKRDAAALAKLEKAIKRDMGSRTSFSKYTTAAGLQDGLFGLCKAYALFDEGVGYAQGINFVAMPLLFNMGEEEAFTLLVAMMRRYDLRSMFLMPDMPGLHLRLYQFERLLEDLEPALYCHLKRKKVDAGLYATQWFLTLFAYRFPLQLVLRVYDLVLSEGLTAILKFGIVLMQRNRDVLMGMGEMGALCSFLKEKLFDVYIDKNPSASSMLDSGFFGSVVGGGPDRDVYRADEMVRDACEVRITEAMLAGYTAEWEETTRLERERTEELESLRSANAVLTTRVKALEERTQQQDQEHVTLASDLVRAKMEVDRLLDDNEVLEMKVQELTGMVERQPAEVEARLQGEMERIMQRNSEVQNENRSVREEMEEMEREFVEVKMALAQVSGLCRCEDSETEVLT